MLEKIRAIEKAIGTIYPLIEAALDADFSKEDALKVYERLRFLGGLADDLVARLKVLHEIISMERALVSSVSERFYVYCCAVGDQQVELSLRVLSEASGSMWHDLAFAARHWQRMNSIGAHPKLSSTPIRSYAVMGYNCLSGTLRRVEQAEIDAALT